MAMVGMIVGDDRPGDVGHVRRQQLLAQVGAAIHQQPLAFALNQDRGTGAPVLRLIGIAIAPVISDPRHAGRGAGPQNANPHAALLNSLKKLAVVASASSSSGSSRKSDRKA